MNWSAYHPPSFSKYFDASLASELDQLNIPPTFQKMYGVLASGYWSVDAKAETAMGGVWKKGPGAGLFKSLNDVSAVPNSSLTCAVDYLA